MALVLKDRVKEATTTTGTGTLTLDGSPAGFQTFSVIGNGNTTYYTITDNIDWEVGIGTYSSSGPSLSRDEVLASSNSNNLVNWGAGSKDVFVTYPAEEAAFFGQAIPTYAYENRNDLRTLTPEPNEQAVVDGLGLFIFQLGSTALDDDETCFATSNGRWLLQGASFDLVEAWTMPRESLQEQITQNQVLYGSGNSNITSVGVTAAVQFTISVPGALPGAAVTVSPPAVRDLITAANSFFGTGGRVGVFGAVLLPNIVTVSIFNPSASTSQTLSGTIPFTVTVVNPK